MEHEQQLNPNQKTIKGTLQVNMAQSLIDFVHEQSHKLQVSPTDYVEHLVWFDFEIKKQANRVGHQEKGNR